MPSRGLSHVVDRLPAGRKTRVVAHRLAVGADGGKSAGRVVVGRSLIVEVVASIAVFIRHVPLDVLVGLRLGGPGPAVAGDFAAVVEVVQQDKSLGQCVQVGRHVPPEDAAGGVTVALRQIAEHLIVGAVFLHDVDDMLDPLRLIGSQ